MAHAQRIKRLLSLLWGGLLLGLPACYAGSVPLIQRTLPPLTSPSPTPTLTATAPRTNALPELGVWEVVAEGLSRRIDAPEDGVLSQLITLRIDPALYTFRAHYDGETPRNLRAWQDTLPDAVAGINANFFTPEYELLGLLIADGNVHGTPYLDRGGFFAIDADGVPVIEANVSAGYTRETITQTGYTQLVQAFPLLVQDGEQTYFALEGDRNTRRTAISIDSEGHILLTVSPLLGVRLAVLSDFLANSDLDIVHAFNLDGGGSTLMWITPLDYTLFSRDRIPSVLAIYPK